MEILLAATAPNSSLARLAAASGGGPVGAGLGGDSNPTGGFRNNALLRKPPVPRLSKRARQEQQRPSLRQSRTSRPRTAPAVAPSRAGPLRPSTRVNSAATGANNASSSSAAHAKAPKRSRGQGQGGGSGGGPGGGPGGGRGGVDAESWQAMATGAAGGPFDVGKGVSPAEMTDQYRGELLKYMAEAREAEAARNSLMRKHEVERQTAMSQRVDDVIDMQHRRAMGYTQPVPQARGGRSSQRAAYDRENMEAASHTHPARRRNGNGGGGSSRLHAGTSTSKARSRKRERTTGATARGTSLSRRGGGGKVARPTPRGAPVKAKDADPPVPLEFDGTRQSREHDALDLVADRDPLNEDSLLDDEQVMASLREHAQAEQDERAAQEAHALAHARIAHVEHDATSTDSR